MDPDVKVGATICKMQYDKILKYLDIAREEGARVLCGGGPVTPDSPDFAVSSVNFFTSLSLKIQGNRGGRCLAFSLKNVG
jgi:hypothetical protein